ncbi:MAG: hypothetical protein KAK00_10010 [Nanoarchaeota archaeon]|nr:hypothetical protein [Nanoarchaeota archaeon]
MVEKEFLGYIDNAIQEYNEYNKLERAKDFSFRDFLLLILVWKVEAMLERMEEGPKR